MYRPQWKLYYWDIPVAGRAEFVRMVFEDAGVAYSEITDSEKILDVVNPETDGWAVMAFPVVEKPAGARLSQTVAICRMLGQQFKLAPEGQPNEGKVEQVMLTALDLFNEIAKVYLTNETPDPEELEKFQNERVPKFLRHFERVLYANRGGSGLYVVGLEATYADFGLFYDLRLLEHMYGDKWESIMGKYEFLSGHFKRIAQRPGLASYLKSKRAKPLKL